MIVVLKSHSVLDLGIGVDERFYRRKKDNRSINKGKKTATLQATTKKRPQKDCGSGGNFRKHLGKERGKYAGSGARKGGKIFWV